MKKRDYDTTVARIAGNIACGLVSKPDPKGAGIMGAEGVADWMKSVVMMSVGLARAIVAETCATEPTKATVPTAGDSAKPPR
jgi:hypothetical protein